MSSYVLGDIHGCWSTLQTLLQSIRLDPIRDRLWLTGDLINRGRRSLDVLRWARAAAAEMGERFVLVLGNHELHLLALHAGRLPPRPRPMLDAILEAPDAEELISWLRRLPLLHSEGDMVLVHAGLHPGWTLDEARNRAREVEARLPTPAASRILGSRQGISLQPPENRMRETLDILTCLRMCSASGEPHPYSGPPQEAPPGCLPWYSFPGRKTTRHLIVFGHWAALGLTQTDGVLGLDSGCAWGGPLSAVRLEDRRIYQVANCDLPPTARPVASRKS